MWQTLITFLIIGIALFFVGRKIYKQIRMAVDPKQSISCGCGSSCSSCSVNICNDKNSEDKIDG